MESIIRLRRKTTGAPFLIHYIENLLPKDEVLLRTYHQKTTFLKKYAMQFCSCSWVSTYMEEKKKEENKIVTHRPIFVPGDLTFLDTFHPMQRPQVYQNLRRVSIFWCFAFVTNRSPIFCVTRHVGDAGATCTWLSNISTLVEVILFQRTNGMNNVNSNRGTFFNHSKNVV